MLNSRGRARNVESSDSRLPPLRGQTRPRQGLRPQTTSAAIVPCHRQPECVQAKEQSARQARSGLTVPPLATPVPASPDHCQDRFRTSPYRSPTHLQKRAHQTSIQDNPVARLRMTPRQPQRVRGPHAHRSLPSRYLAPRRAPDINQTSQRAVPRSQVHDLTMM